MLDVQELAEVASAWPLFAFGVVSGRRLCVSVRETIAGIEGLVIQEARGIGTEPVPAVGRHRSASGAGHAAVKGWQLLVGKDDCTLSTCLAVAGWLTGWLC